MKTLLIITLLIIYGSLYPGNFLTPEQDAFEKFLLDWRWTTSLSDMLGNVILFIPFGLVSSLIAEKHYRSSMRLALFFFSGFVLALVLQIAQIWLPSRSAILADVIWNMVGLLMGIIIAAFVKKFTQTKIHTLNTQVVIPLAILILWLCSELIPLVPSIDLQKFKDAVKPLFIEFDLSLPVALLHVAGVFVAASILKVISNYPLRWLTFIVSTVIAGKIIIISLQLDFTTLVGLIIGYLLSIVFLYLETSKLFATSFWVLIIAGTLERIIPFSLASEGTLNLIPFATMLKGSMQTSAVGLSQSLFIYSALLWLTQKMGGSFKGIAIAIVMWVIFIELTQMLLLGRTADITEPLLIILISWVFTEFQRHTNKTQEQTPYTKSFTDKIYSPPQAISSTYNNGFLLLSIVLMIGITSSIWYVLRLPGIPYNVKELFLGNGHLLFIFIFVQALFWIGTGAAWVSQRVATSIRPYLTLPCWVMLASFISLALLSLSVTQESIADIAGSNNLYWFVMNRDIWGENWKYIFEWIGPETISLLERIVRYTALYSPLIIFLVFFIFPLFEQKKLTAKQSIPLIIATLLWLWLAKAIAFDWSSTDNLNELIARDGPMGWGGGGYLYALLLLLCFNATLLAKASNLQFRNLFALVVTIAILPIGWWLLTNGLEANIEKYGNTFSGAQFLLGPDRKQTLPEIELFTRWCIVQISFVTIISFGIRNYYQIRSLTAKIK